MADEPLPSRAANPSAAPGQLELVRAFVNTLDIEAGTDELESPASTGAWLAHRGVRGVRPDAAEVARLRELREAIRDALSTRGTASEPTARARLNRMAAAHPLVVRLGAPASTPLLSIDAGIDGFRGRLLATLGVAVLDGTWFRLKACPNDRCRWAFYDHSRNGSRTWCSMELCGSRAKMRTYRARRRSGAPAG